MNMKKINNLVKTILLISTAIISQACTSQQPETCKLSEQKLAKFSRITYRYN